MLEDCSTPGTFIPVVCNIAPAFGLGMKDLQGAMLGIMADVFTLKPSQRSPERLTLVRGFSASLAFGSHSLRPSLHDRDTRCQHSTGAAAGYVLLHCRLGITVCGDPMLVGAFRSHMLTS